jgi:hypothetical protein
MILWQGEQDLLSFFLIQQPRQQIARVTHRIGGARCFRQSLLCA